MCRSPHLELALEQIFSCSSRLCYCLNCNPSFFFFFALSRPRDFYLQMAYFRLSFRIWIICVLSDGDLLHIYFCYTLSKFFKSSFRCSTSNLQWSPVNTVTNGPKKLAVLMGDRNNEGFFCTRKFMAVFPGGQKKWL